VLKLLERDYRKKTSRARNAVKTFFKGGEPPRRDHKNCMGEGRANRIVKKTRTLRVFSKKVPLVAKGTRLRAEKKTHDLGSKAQKQTSNAQTVPTRKHQEAERVAGSPPKPVATKLTSEEKGSRGGRVGMQSHE